MRTRDEAVARITQAGLIAVLRTHDAAIVAPIAEALIEGGIRVLEVTLTTPDALRLIQQLAAGSERSRTLVGAGSVLTGAMADAALGAGADFIVSPICRPEIVPVVHAANRPVMIGSYTPTEAQIAHESGADFVKLFPAESLGAQYIRALRAPLPHLRIVPTGGVDLTTVAPLLKAGCAALGVGSALLKADILARNAWSELTKLAADFVAAVAAARSPTTG